MGFLASAQSGNRCDFVAFGFRRFASCVQPATVQAKLEPPLIGGSSSEETQYASSLPIRSPLSLLMSTMFSKLNPR